MIKNAQKDDIPSSFCAIFMILYICRKYSKYPYILL